MPATAALNVIGAVPGQHALGADETPLAFPTGALAFRAPGAAIGEDDIIGKFEGRIGGSAVLVPGAFGVAFNAIDGARLLVGDIAGGIESVDRHVEEQDIVHLFAEAPEMRAEEEIAMDGSQVAD